MKKIRSCTLFYLASTLVFSCISFATHLEGTLDTSLPWEEYKNQTIESALDMYGWCSEEKADTIMELVKECTPYIAIEVGVYGGRSFFPAVAAMEYIAQQNKRYGIQAMAYAIDPWKIGPAVSNMDGEHRDFWEKLDYNFFLCDFITRMGHAGLDNRYTLLRITSDEAHSLLKINDGSIGFLHIDGNHSEEISLADVKAWLPKVKRRGYIIFDDAHWPSTQKAVQYLLDECTLHHDSPSDRQYLIFIKK